MYAKVIPIKRLPIKFSVLDYSIPAELWADVCVGQLVEIPFKNKAIYGVIFDLVKQTAAPVSAVKDIKRIAVKKPLLVKEQFYFLKKMSELYAAPLGFLLKLYLFPLQIKKIAEMAKENWATPAKQLNLTIKHLNAPSDLYVYNNAEEKNTFLKKILTQAKPCLILAPVIAQIDELFKALPKARQKQAAVIKGDLGNKELFKIWKQVWRQKKNIIIGTRRAIFLPWQNLRAIVIVDEGNPGHKSWEMAPRFNNLDAAEILAKLYGAKLIILTLTPSVETYHKALTGLINPQTEILPKPIRPQIINLREERLAKNFSLISEYLKQELLNNKGISFLYLNKRGAAQYVSCKDCGYVYNCPNCKVVLAYFDNDKTLRCRQCGYKTQFSLNCPNCQGQTVAMRGAGAQTLAKELKQLNFIGRKIILIDNEEGDKIDFNCGPGDIVAGTSYAINRLNWQNITLVALIDADQFLFVPEYRAAENIWQFAREAAKRVKTPLIIQTTHPDHLIFKALFKPELFYNNEIKQRKIFGYPPFSYIVKLYNGFFSTTEAEQKARELSKKLSALTLDNLRVKISANSPMFPEFFKGRHWRAIIVKIPPENWDAFAEELIKNISDDWKIDPNPLNLLGF